MGENSTTYVGAIERAKEFGKRIYAEAIRRAIESAKEVCVIRSGVLEAGCRTVIGQRLKQLGMHWSVRGANSIIALRCCFLSNRWEDFWESRRSA